MMATGRRVRCWRLLWLLHWLPLRLQAALGARSAGCCTRWRASGARIAPRNVQLCLPELDAAAAPRAAARALPLARPQRRRARRCSGTRRPSGCAG